MDDATKLSPLIDIALSDTERRVLKHGLLEWSGPARCSDALALAMGFGNVDDLWDESDRIISALETKAPLSSLDWARTLLATEICFASDVLGAGVDWSTVSGLDDAETLRLLRGIQHKIGVDLAAGQQQLQEL